MNKLRGMKLIVWMLIGLVARSQNTTMPLSVKQFLEQVTNTYNQTPFLSFDINYTYATADKPSMILDSLYGRVQINKGNYKIQLDSTVSIKNDQHVIVLFKEDKVILVSNVSRKNIASSLPFIDSSLYNIKNADFALTTNKNIKKLEIRLPDESLYRSITLEMDMSSGYIIRSKYIMAEEKDDGGNQRDAGNKQAAYVIVESVFSNYKKNSFPASVFTDSNFFTIEGENLKAVAPYEDYKLIGDFKKTGL